MAGRSAGSDHGRWGSTHPCWHGVGRDTQKAESKDSRAGQARNLRLLRCTCACVFLRVRVCNTSPAPLRRLPSRERGAGSYGLFTPHRSREDTVSHLSPRLLPLSVLAAHWAPSHPASAVWPEPDGAGRPGPRYSLEHQCPHSGTVSPVPGCLTKASPDQSWTRFVGRDSSTHRASWGGGLRKAGPEWRG